MIEAVVKKVSQLKRLWPNADIWEIMDRLSIIVDFQNFIKFDKKLKGYCFYTERKYYVVIDENLPSFLQGLIAWHELGHVLFDADSLIMGNVFYDHSFSKSIILSEKQANYFAAEGYIDEDYFLELVMRGETIDRTAMFLRIPRDFAVYKIEILKEYGHKLRLSESSNSLCLQDDIYG